MFGRSHRFERCKPLWSVTSIERRLDLDKRIRVEAVEARAQRERIGADMAYLDPVAGVDRLRQPEWA